MLYLDGKDYQDAFLRAQSSSLLEYLHARTQHQFDRLGLRLANQWQLRRRAMNNYFRALALARLQPRAQRIRPPLSTPKARRQAANAQKWKLTRSPDQIAKDRLISRNRYKQGFWEMQASSASSASLPS